MEVPGTSISSALKLYQGVAKGVQSSRRSTLHPSHLLGAASPGPLHLWWPRDPGTSSGGRLRCPGAAMPRLSATLSPPPCRTTVVQALAPENGQSILRAPEVQNYTPDPGSHAVPCAVGPRSVLGSRADPSHPAAAQPLSGAPHLLHEGMSVPGPRSPAKLWQQGHRWHRPGTGREDPEGPAFLPSTAVAALGDHSGGPSGDGYPWGNKGKCPGS